MHLRMCIHTHTYTHACIHTHIHTCVCAFMYLCVCMYVRTYVCMYTYVRTCSIAYWSFSGKNTENIFYRRQFEATTVYLQHSLLGRLGQEHALKLLILPGVPQNAARLIRRPRRPQSQLPLSVQRAIPFVCGAPIVQVLVAARAPPRPLSPAAAVAAAAAASAAAAAAAAAAATAPRRMRGGDMSEAALAHLAARRHRS